MTSDLAQAPWAMYVVFNDGKYELLARPDQLEVDWSTNISKGGSPCIGAIRTKKTVSVPITRACIISHVVIGRPTPNRKTGLHVLRHIQLKQTYACIAGDTWNFDYAMELT